MLGKQMLSWPLHRLRETVGAYAYTRPQRYAFTYRVLLSVKKPCLVTLAVPLPRETPHQQLKNLVIQLPETKEAQDPVFGNRFLFTTFHAPAGQIETAIFRSEAEIRPFATRGVDSSQLFSQEEYGSFLHPDDARIQQLAKRIGQGSCARETARRINGYIVNYLVYGDPIDDLYSDLDALAKPRVDCGGFDTLFVSLCLANKIPARVVSGFWLDGEKNDMHAWAEFQDEEGRWIPVDPSVEQMARQGRTRKSGRFGYIGSDRLTLSVGCHIPIEENNVLFHAPILQHPFLLEGGENVTCRGKIQLVAR